MTTQQPTQQPEAPESPLSDRVSKLEGVSEQVNLRLKENTEALNTMRTENHLEHESLRSEIRTLNDKVDRQCESLRTEINGLRAEVNRLRTDMYRQTFLLFGMIGGLMALFTFLD